MRFIPISQVLIKPDRQRQEFDPAALQDLVTSIEERGLLHPPVLRDESGVWTLVAGERRMKAIARSGNSVVASVVTIRKFPQARCRLPTSVICPTSKQRRRSWMRTSSVRT